MRIVYMGTPDFAVPPLEALVEAGHEVLAVYTQPDRPRQRGKQYSPTPVKARSLELGIPVHTPEKINAPEVLEELAALGADLFVVVAYGQFLSEKLFRMPRYGSINIHASLLPAYRGAAPIHWAILNGEKKSGVTIMQIDKGMDSGDMLLHRETEIGPEEDTGSLHDRLCRMGAELLMEALHLIEAGQIQPVPQDPALVSFAPPLKKEHEVIDWNRPAQVIHDQIRGLSPWPGCHSTWRGKRLKIRASLVLEETSQQRPGLILDLNKQGIVVACGQGSLLLQQLQPEGKSMMDAGAFVRGYHPELGEVLGEE